MSDAHRPLPLISRLYSRFVREGNSAAFIRDVADSYTLPTLHRLSLQGDRVGRRAAVLAVTYLGGSSSIPFIGRALRDGDRAVRVIAEDGIRAVWSRVGSTDQRQRLQAVMRHNRSGQHEEAAVLAGGILSEHWGFAEVWYQRALANYAMAAFHDAVADSRQALRATPYHFPAAVGLGQCHLQLDDPKTAICCFQQALRVNPNLEFARLQIRRLKRDLRERQDL